MKITDEMVEKACRAHHEQFSLSWGTSRDEYWDKNRDAMRLALEEALGAIPVVPNDKLSDFARRLRSTDLDSSWSDELEGMLRYTTAPPNVMRMLVVSANRWDAFSDEEVREIHAGAADRELNHALPGESRRTANDLANETSGEVRKRRGGYQGPGRYETYTGAAYWVYGRRGQDGDGDVILTDVAGRAGCLLSETWDEFNSRREDGTPTYRYVRPLEV